MAAKVAKSEDAYLYSVGVEGTLWRPFAALTQAIVISGLPMQSQDIHRHPMAHRTSHMGVCHPHQGNASGDFWVTQNMIDTGGHRHYQLEIGEFRQLSMRHFPYHGDIDIRGVADLGPFADFQIRVEFMQLVYVSLGSLLPEFDDDGGHWNLLNIAARDQLGYLGLNRRRPSRSRRRPAQRRCWRWMAPRHAARPEP